MAQVVREAVAAYLVDERAGGPDPFRNDDVYCADPAWRLVDVAEAIDGSEEGADASRLDEELYGSIEP